MGGFINGGFWSIGFCWKGIGGCCIENWLIIFCCIGICLFWSMNCLFGNNIFCIGFGFICFGNGSCCCIGVWFGGRNCWLGNIILFMGFGLFIGGIVGGINLFVVVMLFCWIFVIFELFWVIIWLFMICWLIKWVRVGVFIIWLLSFVMNIFLLYFMIFLFKEVFFEIILFELVLEFWLVVFCVIFWVFLMVFWIVFCMFELIVVGGVGWVNMKGWRDVFGVVWKVVFWIWICWGLFCWRRLFFVNWFSGCNWFLSDNWGCVVICDCCCVLLKVEGNGIVWNGVYEIWFGEVWIFWNGIFCVWNVCIGGFVWKICCGWLIICVKMLFDRSRIMIINLFFILI